MGASGLAYACLVLALLAGCSVPGPSGQTSGPRTIGGTPGTPGVSGISEFQGGWDEQACVHGDCTTVGGLQPPAVAVARNLTGFVARVAWTATNPTVQKMSLDAALEGAPFATATSASPLLLSYNRPMPPGNLSFSVHGTDGSVSRGQSFSFDVHVFQGSRFQ